MRALHRFLILRIINSPLGESVNNPLSETSSLLTPQQRDHVETLLTTHFARLHIQMIELAGICLGGAMVLTIITVVALRL